MLEVSLNFGQEGLRVELNSGVLYVFEKVYFILPVIYSIYLVHLQAAAGEVLNKKSGKLLIGLVIARHRILIQPPTNQPQVIRHLDHAALACHSKPFATNPMLRFGLPPPRVTIYFPC